MQFAYAMESSSGFRLSQWKQCLAAFASTLMFYPLAVDIWFGRKSTKEFFEFIYLVPSVILVLYGAIFAAVCSDFCGRKITVLASSLFLPFRIALYFYSHFPKYSEILIFIYVFGLGYTSTAIPLYISEITSINIRHTAMVLPLLTLEITAMLSYFCLSFLTYSIQSSVSDVIATLLSIIILLLCPETPYYLNWRERGKETERSLTFYTGSKYVRTVELIPESRNSFQMMRNAQEWKEKLKAFTEIKNIRNIGMIFVLVLIQWSIGQQHNAYIISAVMPNSKNPYSLIVHLVSIYIISFLTLAIILFSKKISLLAVIVISFIATLIRIWVELPVLISILIVVKSLGHFIFIGVTWSSVGVLFSTDVRAIAIAIVVSLDMLIGTIMSWIEYQMYQQEPEYYLWYYDDPPKLKSYVDLGTLVLAFILVLIFIPKTIEVQPQGTFENYAVVRSRDLELSEL